jgi:hypothetical protein
VKKLIRCYCLDCKFNARYNCDNKEVGIAINASGKCEDYARLKEDDDG